MQNKAFLAFYFERKGAFKIMKSLMKQVHAESKQYYSESIGHVGIPYLE